MLSDEISSFIDYFILHLLLVYIDLISHSLFVFLFDYSPSQGPCCTAQCDFKGRDERCRTESDCSYQSMCSGTTAQCPISTPKENLTACNGDTQVCINGVSTDFLSIFLCCCVCVCDGLHDFILVEVKFGC